MKETTSEGQYDQCTVADEFNHTKECDAANDGVPGHQTECICPGPKHELNFPEFFNPDNVNQATA